MDEFPAAHSMDTTWFAVDRDGHVAVFASGEAGCVPRDAYQGEEVEGLDELRALPAAGTIHDLAGQRAAAGADHVTQLFGNPELVAFVDDVAALGDLVARLGAEPRPATRGTALRFAATDRAAFDELHARRACLGCFYADDDDLAAHGVYSYAHTCDNWIAGPYARTAIPAVPVAREALPELARVVQFDGRFADTPELQPAELWPCESWDPGWLASDRKTVHAFEGHDRGYSQEDLDVLREIDPSLVIVATPTASAAGGRPAPAGAAPAKAQLVPRRPWWKFW